MKAIVYRLTAFLSALLLLTLVLATASLATVKGTDRRPERSDKTVEKIEPANPTTLPEAKPVAPEATVTDIEGPGDAVSTVEEPSWMSPQAGETIPWSCVASGGGACASASFKLCGTIGQTAIGPVSSSSYTNHQGFWQYFKTVVEHCCTGGTVSDVNCSGNVDITDIQVMIDHLFLSLQPLCCAEEGNINYPGSGLPGESDITDITDLQWMVDNQFLTLEPLPPCP